MLARFLIITSLLFTLSGKAEIFHFTLVKGFIVTEARIEGKNVRLILDTGAPGLVLNQRYYTGEDMPKSEDPCPSCNGINGYFTCKNYAVKEWTWLGISHKRTGAIVSDLSFLESYLGQEIHALVGLSNLNGAYATIDFDNKSIDVQQQSSASFSGPFSRYQYVNHIPVIICKINGQKKVLGLDSGSEGNLLFESISAGLVSETHPVKVVDAGNNENLRHRVTMQLEVSGADISNTEEFLVALSGDDTYQNPLLDGILGQDFLSRFKIIIQPGKQKILLIPRLEEPTLAEVVMP
mgnify:CR=1 FL=1